MTRIAQDANGNEIQALRAILPTTRVSLAPVNHEVTRIRASTTIVRLVADTTCWFRVGAPCNQDNGAFLPAGVVEYISIGSTQTINCYGPSGSLYVTEMS
jgi:hypothetical protein